MKKEHEKKLILKILELILSSIFNIILIFINLIAVMHIIAYHEHAIIVIIYFTFMFICNAVFAYLTIKFKSYKCDKCQEEYNHN